MIQTLLTVLQFGFVGLVLLFFAFIILMALKYAIIRNEWESNSLAKIIFYPAGFLFVFWDVVFNYAAWSFIALHFSWEHKTITAHANNLIRDYAIRTSKYAPPEIVNGVSCRIRHATQFAMFTCRHLNNIEPGHCSAYWR